MKPERGTSMVFPKQKSTRNGTLGHSPGRGGHLEKAPDSRTYFSNKREKKALQTKIDI